jgi:hypothetical protein
MKKLLSLLFASTMVLALTMPALASSSGTATTTASTAKTHKAKTNKTHKAKPSTNAKSTAPKAK